MKNPKHRDIEEQSPENPPSTPPIQFNQSVKHQCIEAHLSGPDTHARHATDYQPSQASSLGLCICPSIVLHSFTQESACGVSDTSSGMA